jgi:hypothetical protein
LTTWAWPSLYHSVWFSLNAAFCTPWDVVLTPSVLRPQQLGRAVRCNTDRRNFSSHVTRGKGPLSCWNVALTFVPQKQPFRELYATCSLSIYSYLGIVIFENCLIKCLAIFLTPLRRFCIYLCSRCTQTARWSCHCRLGPFVVGETIALGRFRIILSLKCTFS